MMKAFSMLCALLIGVIGAHAHAEEVTASNGIVLKIIRDDFEPSASAMSPVHQISLGNYFITGTKLENGQVFSALIATLTLVDSSSVDPGTISRASFKGGGVAIYQITAASRQRCFNRPGIGKICGTQQGIGININREEIAKFTEGKVVPVQITTTTGLPILINVPVAELTAVREVAGKF